jgi:hypothetical protein
MTEAFVGTKFVDGDKDWDAPEWRLLLDKELVDGQSVDHSKEQESHRYISENEIGLKHPKNGTIIKLKDDGAIEMFVNEDTGIRLDPKENAVLIYGDVIHMVSKDLDIHTRPHGFSWNRHLFNPALYFSDDKNPLPQFTSKNGSDYSLFSEKPRPSLYDEKVITLLNDLGIEVKKR